MLERKDEGSITNNPSKCVRREGDTLKSRQHPTHSGIHLKNGRSAPGWGLLWSDPKVFAIYLRSAGKDNTATGVREDWREGKREGIKERNDHFEEKERLKRCGAKNAVTGLEEARKSRGEISAREKRWLLTR